MTIDRRSFVTTLAAGAAAVAHSPELLAREPHGAAPGRIPANGPVAIASGNGLRGVERAHRLMTTESLDPLDAAIAGVNIQELDPSDHSVGIGGLPNEHGVVQLDASCMHGPTNRAGAVGALEDIATPSLVAKAVMDYTDHIMLVGQGARAFALAMGFEETELLTEEARQMWLRWKARQNPGDNWLDHDADVEIRFTTGTINMCAVDANGDLGSVTTTSGLSWKLPGRVGDSPIIGAGQYCDNRVGAAGSTGRGEANIKACGAFYVVEQMRLGAAPEEACLRALRRVVEMTEDRLLRDGRPLFNLEYYALAKDGRHGGARIYGEGRYAVCDASGARMEPMAYLWERR